MRRAVATVSARPIRIVVAFAPAGPTDVIDASWRRNCRSRLGQQVVVDNRPGAGGDIGIGIAANAPPDGQSLLIVRSALVLNPGLYAGTRTMPRKASARFQHGGLAQRPSRIRR